jgi:uncharacterized damage-inducible protein DinB
MKGAHLDFDEAVKDFPMAQAGAKAPGAPHTPWQLLEHLRITQEDILDFCRNPNYVEKKWPDEYWPATAAPPDAAAWEHSAKQFRADLRAMQALAKDTANDLMAPLPHGTGQTLLREVLLVVDHNSYHLGQLVYARKTLEAAK